MDRTVSIAAHHARSLRFALGSAGAVTGTVTDAAGHPLQGIVVTAQMPQPYLEPSFGFGSAFFGGGSSIVTDRNGSYTLPGLDSNAVVPCFEADGGYRAKCATQSVSTAAGHTTTIPAVSLAKAPSGTIFGRITAASGRPLRGDAFVDLFSNGTGDDIFLPLSRAGRFSASGLAPGPWQVCAYASTGGPLGTVPTCVKRRVTAGHRTQAALKLKTGGALSGRVTGPSGLGVPNAYATVVSGRGNEGTSTDQHGYFTLSGLPSGNYRVCFAGHGSAVRGDETGVEGACLKRRVRADGGRDRIGVDHTMRAGGAVTGRVTDSAGHPLGQVDVTLDPVSHSSNDFGVGDETTGRNGRYRLTDLAPGRYQVCADREVGVYATDESLCLPRPVTITRAHTVRAIDLRLESPALIHVRVTDAAGHPLAGVEVAALRQLL